MNLIYPVVPITESKAIPLPGLVKQYVHAPSCLILIVEPRPRESGIDLVVVGNVATAAFFFGGSIPSTWHARRILWFERAEFDFEHLMQSGKWWSKWCAANSIRQRAFAPITATFSWDESADMGVFGFHKKGIFRLRIATPNTSGTTATVLSAVQAAGLQVFSSFLKYTADDDAMLVFTCGTIEPTTAPRLQAELLASLDGVAASITVDGDDYSADDAAILGGRFKKLSSVFISYSHADLEFVLRLHNILSRRGIRCWLDNHEFRPGDRLLDTIRHGILAHDKFLLICSRASLHSWWVDSELEEVFAKERAHGESVLVPIAIDSAIWSDPPLSDKCVLIRSRYVGNFVGWATPRTFRRSVDKLLKAFE